MGKQGIIFLLCNYSGILPQRHKGTKIIGLILYNSLFNAWHIEINEKTPLFNLYPSSLWVFVPWWLNSYFAFCSGWIIFTSSSSPSTILGEERVIRSVSMI